MVEGLTELEIKAFESAGRLFDSLVDKALRGESLVVEVAWTEADSGEEDAVADVRASINGIASTSICAQHIRMGRRG